MSDSPKDDKDLGEVQPQELTRQPSDAAGKDGNAQLTKKARYSDLFTVFACGCALISVSTKERAATVVNSADT